jgi:hypothetical protein
MSEGSDSKERDEGRGSCFSNVASVQAVNVRGREQDNETISAIEREHDFGGSGTLAVAQVGNPR